MNPSPLNFREGVLSSCAGDNSIEQSAAANNEYGTAWLGSIGGAGRNRSCLHGLVIGYHCDRHCAVRHGHGVPCRGGIRGRRDLRPPKAVAPSSLKPGSMGVTAEGGTGRDKKVEPPSNVLPLPREGVKAITPQVVPPRPGTGLSLVGSRVPDFARDCLHRFPGRSLGASDVWGAYETWCAKSRSGANATPETWSGANRARLLEVEVMRLDPLPRCAPRGLNCPSRNALPTPPSATCAA